MLCFNIFLSENRMQDSATTTAHNKNNINCFEQHNNLSTKLSTIWENTYGCYEHYICATALYLL